MLCQERLSEAPSSPTLVCSWDICLYLYWELCPPFDVGEVGFNFINLGPYLLLKKYFKHRHIYSAQGDKVYSEGKKANTHTGIVRVGQR